MTFAKSTAAIAVIGLALSGSVVSAQTSGADTGTNRSPSTTTSGQQGSMMKQGGMMKSDGTTGRSSSNGPTALGTGNDRTTATGGNAGGRADKN